MNLFFTESVKYLEKNFEYSKYKLDRFCDGELYLKLETDVKNREVFVITNTMAPSDNILELTFLLDALTRQNAKINLFFTYFGYSRQDRINEEGEAVSAEVISRILRLFDINKIFILHPHSDKLSYYLNFKPIIPFSIFAELAKNFDFIVSPDKGGAALVKKIAELSNTKFFSLTKKRIDHDNVAFIEGSENVSGKRILIIDDMITTGSTIIKSAELLYKNGASIVDVAATHGVFCSGAIEKLENSSINKIYVTDSIKQNQIPDKFEVISIAPIIEKEIYRYNSYRIT